MGNRGRLHGANRDILRRQIASYRAWVTCVLAFKGRRRTVMTPDRYTELFFLDEATALAAGHRPCGECRRDDYRRFRTAWLAGNPDRGVAAGSRIDDLDRELHRDRLSDEGSQRTFEAEARALPGGVFVARDPTAVPLLLWDDALWPWAPDGYGDPVARVPGERMIVLTPRSTMHAIAAGYAPRVHPTAQRLTAR
jgi:hypothetical protein